MEHPERMKFAETFAKKIVDKYGSNVTMVAVAGNTGKGTDTTFSDVDMVIVTKKPVREPYKFVYKDTIPEPFYVTRDQAKEIAADPSGPWDWLTWTMLFFSIAPVYGTDKVVDEYMQIASNVQSSKYKKEAGRKLVLMQEWLNHTHGANEKGNLFNSVQCAVNFNMLALEYAVMLNETHYESHAYFELSKKFSKLPKDFHTLVQRLGTSNNVKEIHDTMTTLLNNCMASARENGIQAEIYNSLEELKA